MERSLLFLLVAFCCISRLFASHIPNIHVYSVDSRHEDLKARSNVVNGLDDSDQDDDVEQVIKVGKVTLHLHNHPYGKLNASPSIEPEALQRNADPDVEQKPQQFPDAEPRIRNFVPNVVNDEEDQVEQNGDELKEHPLQEQPLQEPEQPKLTQQSVPMNPLFSVFRFLLTPPPRPFFPSPLQDSTDRLDVAGPQLLRHDSEPHPFAPRFVAFNEHPIF